MTTETTNPAPSVPERVEKPLQGGGEVVSFNPQNSEQAWNVAQRLARAGEAIPAQYRGKPDTILAVMMRGADLKLPVMQALESIAMVNGKATLFGDGLKAVIYRAGHRLDVHVENEDDLENMVAVAALTRGDTGQVIERSFGWRDAKKAELLSKDTYKKYPRRMFMARAVAWACRDGAPAAPMGLGVREEEEDLTPHMRNVTPVEDGNVTGLAAVVARRNAPKAEPLVEDAEPAEEAFDMGPMEDLVPFEETDDDR